MRRLGLVCSLLLASVICFAGKVSIVGKAVGYEGKQVTLVTYKDYISMTPQTIASGLVDDAGSFFIEAEIEQTFYSLVQIGSVSSILYIQPETKYYVNFPLPGKDTPRSIHDTKIEMTFDSLRSDDINFLILDFDYRYDYFVTENMLILHKPEFKLQLDTFKQKIASVFSKVDNRFLMEYIYYSTAMLELMGEMESSQGFGRASVFEQYFKGKTIDYKHDKYMFLFNDFYAEPFSYLTVDATKNLGGAINDYASMKLLLEIFKKDRFLADKNFRELVVIKGLMENYYKPEFIKENVLIILDSLSKFAEASENREIASNVYKKLTSLNKGYAAPDFTLTNLKGDTISLSQFRGCYVYLSFWTTWNREALTELKLYPGFQKRYENKFVFISVNMNENKKDFEDFMKKNPQYNWYFLYGYSDNEIWNKYQIKSLPSYFLIDPEGNFRQSPALRPMPNGTFKSIDETFHNIYWNDKRQNIKSECNR